MENKKQKKLNPDLIILICVTAIVLACVIFHPAFNAVTNRLFHEYIVAEQVEKIDAPGGTLNEEEAAEFIKLFNTSSYAGEGIGDGGTPEVHVFVYYTNGSYLSVSEFNGKNRDFEVFLRNADGKTVAWYYVNSDKLQDFISKRQEKD